MKRIYHFADKLRSDGAVSALCYRRPRPINMSPSSRYTWTTTESAVTCPRCRIILAERNAAKEAKQ